MGLSSRYIKPQIDQIEYSATVKIQLPRKKQLRKAHRKQLGYLRHNLVSTDRLEKYYCENPLTAFQKIALQTVKELYRQQKYIYDHKTHSVANRVINISPPHVVRGKVSANV